MDFKERTFKISDDISITVLVSEFDGEPIAIANSLKLTYRGKIQAMEPGTLLYDAMTKKGLESLTTVHMLNHLCRDLYGINLFEIYNNSTNDGWFTKLMTRKKNFLNKNGTVNVEELNKLRNDEFPMMVNTLDELQSVPFFTYVQSENIYICHLAFIIERLSHLDLFSDINYHITMSFLEHKSLDLEIKDIKEQLKLKNNELNSLRERLHVKELELKTVIDKLRHTTNYMRQNINNEMDVIALFKTSDTKVYDIYAGNPKYMKDKDNLIEQVQVTNAKDMLRYIKNNMNTKLGLIINRKVITDNINDVIQYIRTSVNSINDLHQLAIMNELDRLLNQASQHYNPHEFE